VNGHQLTTHAKHLLIAAGCLALLWFVASRYMETRVKLATIQATSTEKIKANDKTFQQAQTSIDTSSKNVQAIDTDTKQKLAGLQQQLNSKPDSEQIKKIVQGLLPGVQTVQAKDAQGNPLIAVADTQENRDKINEADVAFKSCRFELDGCQRKQTEFLNTITQQGVQIEALKGTVQTLKETNKELTRWGKGGNFWARTGRVAIPVGCGGLAAWLASKAKADARATGIAAIGGGATCAFSVRF